MRTQIDPASDNETTRSSRTWWSVGLWSLRLLIVALLALVTYLLFLAADLSDLSLTNAATIPLAGSKPARDKMIVAYEFAALAFIVALLIPQRPRSLVMLTQAALFALATWALAGASQRIDADVQVVQVLYVLIPVISGLLSVYWIVSIRLSRKPSLL